MEILGSIQSEGVVVEEREKMQRKMRDFISRIQRGRRWETGNIVYKVFFWKPLFGAKVDSLIEFRSDGREAWFARANGPDPWKSFCRALGSLKQIVLEMELREEGVNAGDENGAA
ncbi:MAG: hypothetical protein ACXVB9_17900 [Bdellovibrionota bacterium]